MEFHRWPFLFLPHNAGVLSAARILTNTHSLLSQTGLGLWLAHRTLLLPKTQRTCHQRRVQQDRRGSEGSFFGPVESRLQPQYQFLRHCLNPTKSASASPKSRETGVGLRDPLWWQIRCVLGSRSMRCTSERSKSEIPVKNP